CISQENRIKTPHYLSMGKTLVPHQAALSSLLTMNLCNKHGPSLAISGCVDTYAPQAGEGNSSQGLVITRTLPPRHCEARIDVAIQFVPSGAQRRYLKRRKENGMLVRFPPRRN
ncbi:MAG: hypothetical protein LBF50_06350, partial [Azoarcus sp.]|nr:hypothetical protein [Azoarcus sp.]